MEFWQIEAWQDNSYDWPVRNYRNLTLKAEPKKFPHGMKWLAGQIRQAGFRPGIWTVPWGTGDDNFYREHRDWFLHDAKGQPFQNWAGRYMLDASLPEVRRHMEETHRIMSADWGYEFFKTDGISFAVRMFEREDVRAAFHRPCAEPFRLSMEALRRGIGADRILLACAGHYMGPEVAYADASRIGGDLVARNEKPSWKGYLSQARVTLAQLFTHNLIWYNDPDTLMVGEAAPIGMARVATTIVALPGQLTFVSDKIHELPPARMRLIQQALPVCDVRPLDLVPILDLKPVWDLKLRRSFGIGTSCRSSTGTTSRGITNCFSRTWGLMPVKTISCTSSGAGCFGASAAPPSRPASNHTPTSCLPSMSTRNVRRSSPRIVTSRKAASSWPASFGMKITASW